MKKILEFIFFSSLIVGIFTYLYVSIPSTDYFLLRSEKHFDSTSEFENVHSSYIGKVVDIKGIVNNIDKEEGFTNITLDIFFFFSLETINIKNDIILNDVLVIKGRYEGYDDLFNEYSFTDCSVK